VAAKTKGVVREVAVPPGSLVAGAFAKISFEDAWAVDLPAGDTHDVDALVRLIATSAPRWAEQLMWLRDRIVSLVGLRRSEKAPRNTSTALLRPGDKLSIFQVLDRSDNEIMFGADDKHLDFRASLLVQRDAARPSAVLSTVVRYNNWLGRVYFFFVRPFHRLIVASLLRNVRRRVEADG
jgi:hypothetical protein